MANKLPIYNEHDLQRVWNNPDTIKVFISHRDTYKIDASKIQAALAAIGISSFVAHNDIQPTEEWVKEILIALQTMDVLLAYITPDFHLSSWTNQEIGFALGKNIPIIPFKIDIPPQGFISIIQAKSFSYSNYLYDIIDILLNKDTITNKLRLSQIDRLIDIFSHSYSFDGAANNFKFIEIIERLEPYQVDNIINAFNSNDQIYASFYLNGYNIKGKVNDGLICQKLYDWTGKKYEINQVPYALEIREKL